MSICRLESGVLLPGAVGVRIEVVARSHAVVDTGFVEAESSVGGLRRGRHFGSRSGRRFSRRSCGFGGVSCTARERRARGEKYNPTIY